MVKNEILTILKLVKAAFQSFSISEEVGDVWYLILKDYKYLDITEALKAYAMTGKEKPPQPGQLAKIIDGEKPKTTRVTKEVFTRDGDTYTRITTTYKDGRTDVREIFQGNEAAQREYERYQNERGNVRVYDNAERKMFNYCSARDYNSSGKIIIGGDEFPYAVRGE